MSVSETQLNRAIAQANVRESQGYFARAKAGDQRAASLFVRLIAHDLNPNGFTNEYGWLSKSPGETQVDGYAEDAICANADQSDRMNVVDLITGAGAPGADIPNTATVKERRENNRWVKPQPLSDADMSYLLSGGQPIPAPMPPPQGQPYPDETPVTGWWDSVFTPAVRELYEEAHLTYPDNDRAFRWASRTAYDIAAGMTKEASLAKHLAELEQELGL